jgi:hypothetical protein
MEDEGWLAVMAFSIHGTILLCREFARVLANDGNP